MLDLYKSKLSFFLKTYRGMIKKIRKDINKEEKIEEKIEAEKVKFEVQIALGNIKGVKDEYHKLVSEFTQLIDKNFEIQKIDLLLEDKIRVEENDEFEMIRSVDKWLEKVRNKIDDITYKRIESEVRQISNRIVQIQKIVRDRITYFTKKTVAQEQNHEFNRTDIHTANPVSTAIQYARRLRWDFKKLLNDMKKIFGLEKKELKILRKIETEKDAEKFLEDMKKINSFLDQEVKDFNKTQEDLNQIFNFASYKFFVIKKKIDALLGGGLKVLNDTGYPNKNKEELEAELKQLTTHINEMDTSIKNMERRMIQLHETE
jgi:hypothetical protein